MDLSKRWRIGWRAVAACCRGVLLLVCMAVAGALQAAPVVLGDLGGDEPLGSSLEYLVDEGGARDLAAAQAAFVRGEGRAAGGRILSLGIGRSPVWIRLSLDNVSAQAQRRRLTIENAWLDHIEFHFLVAGSVVATHSAGDAQAADERGLGGRFFSVDHDFAPGVTDVYLRVATDDPLIVPVYLRELEQARQAGSDQGYRYGLLYGYLIALAAYNLLIHFSIRDRRYLLYSVFLGAFVAMNLAYTGHGMMWLWPDWPALQRWIIPCLMMAFGLAGLLFARRFLDAPTHLPRLERLLRWCTTGFVLAFVLVLAPAGSPAWPLRIAFAFSLFFTVAMVTLGVGAVRERVPSARYFLLASLASACGAGLTALTVWGLIDFRPWAYHAVEVGMLLDATLLGIALGGQFRTAVLARMHAEVASRELSALNQRLNASIEELAHVAATDGLTGLWNRRHFEDRLTAELERAGRYGQPLSLLLFDIDHFKAINDTCGHQAGDAVLRELAAVVRARMRRSDAITRWGGEEFTVLIPNVPQSGAHEAAEKLRQAVEAHVFPNGLRVTVSIGVAQWAGRPEPADRWIARADHALYEAKRGGRNRVVLADQPRQLRNGGIGEDGPRLRWSARYEVGDAVVDAQHRGLFEHANRILRLAGGDAEAAGEGPDRSPLKLLTAVDALLADVREHCAAEEAVLAERGASELEAHRAEHARLLGRALILREGLAQTPPSCTVAEVVDFVCVELVANHVLRFDRQSFATLAPADTAGAVRQVV